MADKTNLLPHRYRTHLLLLVGITTLLSIATLKVNPVCWLMLVFGYGLMGFFSVICLLLVLLKKNFLKYALAGLFLSSWFFACTLGLQQVTRKWQHRQATEMIAQIMHYQSVNGHYPATLQEINTSIRLHQPTYHSYDQGQSFRLEYYMDGFNREYYDTQQGGWGTLGWND